MGKKIINLSFEQWVEHIFDHPVEDPAWHWDIDSDYYNYEENVHLTVEYLAQLFESPLNSIKPYTDAQINQALWYLIGSSASSYMFTLFEASIPLKLRRQVVLSMYNMFEQVFAPRCSPILEHLQLSGSDSSSINPLNEVCYMWWDIIPLAPRMGDPEREALDKQCLAVMERTLELDSIACREAALHGLGHWKHAYHRKVRRIIDAFLKRTPDIDDDLLKYALSARNFGVL